MGIRENLILTPVGKMASRATDIKHFNDTLTGRFLALPPGRG